MAYGFMPNSPSSKIVIPSFCGDVSTVHEASNATSQIVSTNAHTKCFFFIIVLFVKDTGPEADDDVSNKSDSQSKNRCHTQQEQEPLGSGRRARRSLSFVRQRNCWFYKVKSSKATRVYQFRHPLSRGGTRTHIL